MGFATVPAARGLPHTIGGYRVLVSERLAFGFVEVTHGRVETSAPTYELILRRVAVGNLVLDAVNRCEDHGTSEMLDVSKGVKPLDGKPDGILRLREHAVVLVADMVTFTGTVKGRSAADRADQAQLDSVRLAAMVARYGELQADMRTVREAFAETESAFGLVQTLIMGVLDEDPVQLGSAS